MTPGWAIAVAAALPLAFTPRTHPALLLVGAGLMGVLGIVLTLRPRLALDLQRRWLGRHPGRAISNWDQYDAWQRMLGILMVLAAVALVVLYAVSVYESPGRPPPPMHTGGSQDPGAPPCHALRRGNGPSRGPSKSPGHFLALASRLSRVKQNQCMRAVLRQGIRCYAQRMLADHASLYLRDRHMPLMPGQRLRRRAQTRAIYRNLNLG